MRAPPGRPEGGPPVLHRRGWRLLLILCLISVAIGAAISHFAYGANPLGGALVGLCVGGLYTGFMLLLDARLKRLPFGLALLLRIAAMSLLAVIALNLGIFAFGTADHPAVLDPENLSIYWLASAWWIDVGYIVGIMALISVAIEVDALIGPGVLWQFLIGRYHRPRSEQRVFLFLDLAGSTELAERLGDLRFYRLLQHLMAEVGSIIGDHGGSIDRYVGDSIIATWRLRDAGGNARCLRCCAAIGRHLEARGAWYAEAFGCRPRLRAGLHAGPVVTGEIGASKKEILLLGDTVNTTARLEDACRGYGRPLLVSGDLLGKLALPGGWKAEPLGTFVPRGRRSAVEIFSLRDEGGRTLLPPIG